MTTISLRLFFLWDRPQSQNARFVVPVGWWGMDMVPDKEVVFGVLLLVDNMLTLQNFFGLVPPHGETK